MCLRFVGVRRTLPDVAADWYLHALESPSVALRFRDELDRLNDEKASFRERNDAARVFTAYIESSSATVPAFFMGVADRGAPGSRADALNSVLHRYRGVILFDDSFRRSVLKALNNPVAEPHWTVTVRQHVRHGQVYGERTKPRREELGAFCHPRDFNKFYDAYRGKSVTLVAW